MGVIDRAMGTLFGSGTGALRDTVELFRENAEASAKRSAALSHAAQAQFAAEFAHPTRGWFDSFMDGLNRLPRPAMALGTLGMFVAAMVDPLWFAGRMEGLAQVPEPLWWLLGAIVSFYFGARHQIKGQDFRRSLAQAALAAPVPATAPAPAATAAAPATGDGPPNAALDAWRAGDDG